MISTSAAVLVLLSAFADPVAAADGPPSKEELAAITARGRDLAGYDRAAWHASDAVRAKAEAMKGVAGYIARKTEKGWVVAFGRLDAEKANYLIAYEATEGKTPDEFTAAAFDPPKPDAAFFLAAARASEAAVKDFSRQPQVERRPYNVAVLPGPEGRWWVYVTPAPTKPGVWPLGGDFRYLASPDGTKLVETRRLHKSILEVERPADEGQKQVAGMHTHVLAETPEDTDVFHVLARKPSVPEVIVTRELVFQVDPDGGIQYIGKADDVLKPK